MNTPAKFTIELANGDLLEPRWMTCDPCFLLKVILTPDGLRRTAGTLTGAMYANPDEAMAASGCTAWTRDMFGDNAGEWRSDDGEWIVRRAQT